MKTRIIKLMKEDIMKTWHIKYVLAVFMVLIFASVSFAAVQVKVGVGKGTVITLKEPSKRVSISNPDIADLNVVSPKEVLINGKKVGSTNLIIWDAAGKPTFFDIIVIADTTEVQQVILEVRVAQVDKSKLKELGLSFLFKDSNLEFTTPGLIASPTGSIKGNETGIEGFDLGTLAPQFGISHFPSGIGAVLKALSSKGLAKVLAEPNLIVKSGEKGQFHVGTRFPVQTIQGVGANASVSITYEEVGIRLNFAPEILDSGVIRLKIDPAEVSNITDFIRLENLVAPIIDTRAVRTSVDLKEGESIILAGLLSEEMKKNIKKVPLLGDIPILGAIFRSTSDELREKELAFFITPKIVKAMPPGTKKELPGEKPISEKELREFDWIPMGVGGGEEEKAK